MSRRLMISLRLVPRERSGNVALMSAVLLSVVVVAAALAVDVGSVYFQRREAQALTDLAAITAAAHLESAPEAALLTFTDNRMRKIVLVRDDRTPDPLETTDAEAALYVKAGRYVADPDAEPDEARFRWARGWSASRRAS